MILIHKDTCQDCHYYILKEFLETRDLTDDRSHLGMNKNAVLTKGHLQQIQTNHHIQQSKRDQILVQGEIILDHQGLNNQQQHIHKQMPQQQVIQTPPGDRKKEKFWSFEGSKSHLYEAYLKLVLRPSRYKVVVKKVDQKQLKNQENSFVS